MRQSQLQYRIKKFGHYHFTAIVDISDNFVKTFHRRKQLNSKVSYTIAFDSFAENRY